MSASGSAVYMIITLAAEEKRQRDSTAPAPEAQKQPQRHGSMFWEQTIDFDLHHAMNPLVEGTIKHGEVCTLSDDFLPTGLTRNSNGKIEKIDIDQNLLDSGIIKGTILPNLTIESKFQNNLFKPDTIETVISDANHPGKTIERRSSVMTSEFPHVIAQDDIDTKVFDSTNRLKETIHSRLSANGAQIDTIVKDSAGHTLRELQSTFKPGAPDVPCTRLK